MADVEDLRIVLRAEVDKAVADLKKGAAAGRSAGKDWNGLAQTFTRSAKEALSVQKAFGQLTASVAGGMAIYGLASSALRGIATFAKESVGAYDDSAQALAKLNAVLEATGGAVGLSIYQLNEYAGELQFLTNIEDEAIVSMEGVLATFDIQGEAFKDATRLALDLSKAYDIDLTSSAKQLGKALDNPAQGLSALSRVGVTFTASEKKMIVAMATAGDKAGAQALILDKLEQKVGGVAEAMASKGAGGARQLALAWDDSKELIGKAITESLDPGNRILAAFIKKTNDAITAKQNLDTAMKTGGNEGDVGAAIAELSKQIKTLEDEKAKFQKLLNEENLSYYNEEFAKKESARIEKNIKDLEKKRTTLQHLQLQVGVTAAAEKAASDAAKAAADVDDAREAADREALDHFSAVNAELQKKLQSMALEASLTGTQVSKQDQLNAYTDAYVKLIVDSNGNITEANSLAQGYAATIARLRAEILKMPSGTNYSPLGDMSDLERIYDLFSQTEVGTRQAKEETIAWVEAQRALAQAAGENLAIYDAILNDLRNISDVTDDEEGWNLFPDDSLANTKEALDELGDSLLRLLEDSAVQGLTDAFSSIGEAMAEGADTGDALAASLQQTAATMLKQSAAFAFTAGLRVLAEGGLAMLPLALGLMAIGGVAGIAGGFLGALGGGSPDRDMYDDYIIDPVVEAEKELAKKRLEILEDQLEKEKEIRDEKLDEIEDYFNQEQDVLKDLWERNLITTDEYTAQSAALREEEEAQKAAAEEPVDDAEDELEKEKKKQKEKDDALEELRTSALNELAKRYQHEVDSLNDRKWYDFGGKKKDREDIAEIQAAMTAVQNAQTREEIAKIMGGGTLGLDDSGSKDPSDAKGPNVKAAATGADFITHGPELLMVGDNPGGRERVTVEPIGSQNLYGPSDGGIVIYINAPVYGVDDLYAKLDAAGEQMARRGKVSKGIFA